MQAPILSFDDDGDIPVPTKKHRRKRRSFRFDLSNVFSVVLEYLTSADIDILDSRDSLILYKPGATSISVERTRKDRFHSALRSVSKVAFSQLGLGK